VARLELLTAEDARLTASSDLAVALAQLRAAVGPDQQGTRDEIVDFVAAHPDAAERSCADGHLTGSALVVDADGRRTLLMLHRKLGRWFQPGGHADGDTNMAAVALREAGEETCIEGLLVAVPAIDLDVHQVSPPGKPTHRHLDVRHLVLSPPGAVETANAESFELRWVTLDELHELRPVVDASTHRLVEVGLRAAGELLGAARDGSPTEP